MLIAPQKAPDHSISTENREIYEVNRAQTHDLPSNTTTVPPVFIKRCEVHVRLYVLLTLCCWFRQGVILALLGLSGFTKLYWITCTTKLAMSRLC